jgi:ankyrin repeat protein
MCSIQKSVHHTWIRLTSMMLASLALTAAANGGDLFQAIRNGNLAIVKAELNQETLEARDKRGATPLMHAAAFGNFATLKLLVEAGADVNARNISDATALLWCAGNPEKARFLIENKADVNARSKQGMTPLKVASLRPGNAETVALLLAKGADVNDQGGPFNISALFLAASTAEVETVRLLLANGANPHATAMAGANAITAASLTGDVEAVRLLLAKKVDVNAVRTRGGQQRNGLTNNQKVTALHNAAATGAVEMVVDLIKAGADVNARDSRSLTPLFFALASETPSMKVVRALLAAGADVNARDNTGETPLDWADKFRYSDVIDALKKSGAKHGVAYEAPKPPPADRPKPLEALSRGIALLERTSAEFFRKSGCVGCHHQPIVARAQLRAKEAGIPINDSAAKEQTVQMKSLGVGLTEEYLQAIIPGGGANRIAEMLLGLQASGYPADNITDAAVVAMAESQELDGSWLAGEVQLRPPIAQSHFAATARVARALQAYSIPARKQEFTERIARASGWLKHSKPQTTEDVAMRLSGLTWTGAAESDIRESAKSLLVLQRPDGGWGGNPHMNSDAYATAGALVALAESKVIKVSDRHYQRGVAYLLSTQYPDGSWYVRSRAIKFQPYFESGFPFGHDQWISVAATAWASQALALSIRPPAAALLDGNPSHVRNHAVVK